MVFGYLEGVPLFFKDLLCNLSILELCSLLTFCTWCVLLLLYDICKHLVHYIQPSKTTFICSIHSSKGGLTCSKIIFTNWITLCLMMLTFHAKLLHL
jgi:hypothetical protein